MRARTREFPYFDSRDHEILTMVNAMRNSPGARLQSPAFDANLHPHGIKDMVMSRVSRVAYAVINLLTSLEAGQADDRLRALQALYDDALNSAQTTLRRNTARVLLQIMKDMVRAHGRTDEQLRLAHDFRRAAQGTPRVVRNMLARYHLPEMSEEWDQLAFDNHVYDANTRGRKTPTHLIMDAWIKGLRFLTVVYSNYVELSAAREVLEAAAIVGIKVRVGLEFRSPFQKRLVSLLWAPRGFTTSTDFLEFLESPDIRTLMKMGREASLWLRGDVLRALEHWNNCQRPALAKRWGMAVPPLSQEDFLSGVGTGQPSPIHLAQALHQHLLPCLRSKAEALAARLAEGEDAGLRRELLELEELNAEAVLETWLTPERNPALPHPDAADLSPDAPKLLTMPPQVLVSWLTSLHSGYRITLDLADLRAEDVLELLWDCQGAITHLEIFNLEEWHEGRLEHVGEINEMQRVLNDGRGPRLKQMVRQMIRRMEIAGDRERTEKFREILRNLPILWEYYRSTPLKSRMGTNSASPTWHSFGMGLVCADTVPARSRKTLRENSASVGAIPIRVRLEERVRHLEPETPGPLLRMLRRIPGCAHVGRIRARGWITRESSLSSQGNVVNLGGLVPHEPNHLLPEPEEKPKRPGMAYLSGSLTNWLKILAGFIPSVASFLYTQEWWFMAWFGAFIWFGITGVRNVIQMIMAGQGVSRGTLLRWKDHINVSRICDSLMYTGISVLLLEVLVRVWLLEDGLGISVREHPGLVFTVLNIVNAVYICSHNMYRGFPKQAAIGNLFRSALAIPVSSLYNLAALHLLLWYGVENPLFYLAPSAAIISKLASDTVAAVIEGYADGENNRRMRRWDYRSKLSRVFQCYTRLELLFPEEDVLLKLARTEGMGRNLEGEARRQERALVINALDLMYFWFYQPRAQETLRRLVRNMSQADRVMFARSQLILLRERDISQMFVDGLAGRNFARPLAFYLARGRAYVRAMMLLCRPGRKEEQTVWNAYEFSGLFEERER